MSLEFTELSTVLDAWFTVKLESLHTMFPAKIEKYEGHGTRMATVMPTSRIRLNDGTIIEPLPISGVPVIHPCTSQASILFPIKRGDMVLVCVSEHSIGNWLDADGELVDPEDSSRFTLTDSICIPGLWPKALIPTVDSPTEDELYIGLGATTLRLKPDGKVVIKGDLEVTGEISAMTQNPATKVSVSTHIHPTPAGPSSSPTPGT